MSLRNKLLHSQCRFVKFPTLLSFSTLAVSSLANGVNIWYMLPTEQSTVLVSVTECINFIVWSMLLLLVLRGLVSVHTKAKVGFTKKVENHLAIAAPAAPEQQFQLIGILWVMQDKPAGWFLIGDKPLTSKLFNFSAMLVLCNMLAKTYAILHTLAAG